MSDRLKISLMINTIPSKEETNKACEKKKYSIEEEVRHAILMCESDHESAKDWEFLRKVYNCLTRKKRLNKRQNNLLCQIEPVLRKHASANPSNIEFDIEKSLEAHSLFKI